MRLVLLLLLPSAVVEAGDAGLPAELWVGGWDTHNVLRLDWRTGESRGLFVPSGRGGLRSAHHFSFGPDGDFYVASYGTSQVIRYDGETGSFIDVFVQSGNGLIKAHTAYWNVDGTILVSSEQGDRVLQYNGWTGGFRRTFVRPGEQGLDGPEFIIEGPGGNLYLTAQSRQVLVLDPIDGGVIDVFVADDPDTPDIDETGGLFWPHGLVFGPDGHLYVASSQNNRILRYNGETGAFLNEFVPDGAGGLRFPLGIAFGPDGDFYVASFGNSRVLKYHGSTGAPLGLVASLAPMGLTGPLHIAFVDGPLVRADLDRDGEVSLDDFGLWFGCMTGPNAGPVELDCRQADQDRDDDVDLGDYAAMQIRFGDQ